MIEDENSILDLDKFKLKYCLVVSKKNNLRLINNF